MGGLKVQHACPQCGGKVQLEESDHVLSCGYCGTSHVLLADQYHRFTLPVNMPAQSLLWVPYLHFKGSAFWLDENKVTQRVLHVSSPGVEDAALPPSLGFRIQTQRLRFVTAKTAGTFVRFALKPSQILRNTLAGLQANSAPAYIGETASLIYLPLAQTNHGVFDALSQQRLARVPHLQGLQLATPPVAGLRFLPALCPECGASLASDPQAVALPCTNCESVWEPVKGKLERRIVHTVHTHSGRYTYLPFWCFEVHADGPRTMEQLAALTGQPWPRRQPAQQAWWFRCPAFKIRPRMLLRLCERLSLCEPLSHARADVPRTHRHPVTLPSREAAEMLPVALASMTFRELARAAQFAARPQVSAPVLMYLPFREAGTELINPTLQLSISRSALGFGDAL